MADIIYTLGTGVYVNITNKCPCNCAFCIRSKKEAIGSASNLWFDTEPTFDDIKREIEGFDFANCKEVVFCGYGEPTNAYDNLVNSALLIKKRYPDIKLRLNTNGLSDLINGKPTAKELSRIFDCISVSLNQPTSEKYDLLTRNIFKGKAFDAVLDFTRECVKYCKNVRMTVVDVISKEDIEASRKLVKSLGADFKVRSYEKGR